MIKKQEILLRLYINQSREKLLDDTKSKLTLDGLFCTDPGG